MRFVPGVLVLLVAGCGVGSDSEPARMQSQPSSIDADGAPDSGTRGEPEAVEVDPTPEASCVDSDMDGFFVCSGGGASDSEQDCDDTYASTNPGSEELCDGDDNDCDGEIDEGIENCDVPPGARHLPRPEPPEVPPECSDDDDDGHYHCPGQPEWHYDCDDTWEDNYVGAHEFCDGEDNDCDGRIDENIINCDAPPGSHRPDYPHPPHERLLPAPDCRDDDLDGFWYCTETLSISMDCDDSDPGIPVPTDLPCDGIDNDCNGLIDDQNGEFRCDE